MTAMSEDDFKFEPVRGLPEALPEDEHILWQGAPSARALAREGYKLTWVAGYFAVLAVWRAGASLADFPFTTALGHALPLVIAGLLACAILQGLAYVQARSTVYTLTNKRVAMRIGAALTMTLNLPYVCITSANLSRGARGTGTIAFQLKGDTRFSYLMTWPHVRPWRFNPTEPALRAIPDAETVAALFAEAAEARVSMPQVSLAANDNPAGAAVAAE
jgi:hypothetical protein